MLDNNSKKVILVVLGIILMILSATGQASGNVIDFHDIYQDYNGYWYKYTNENIVQYPMYQIIDNGNNWTISRQGTTVNLPKQFIRNGTTFNVNYQFLPDRIIPSIQINNYTQINTFVVKVNATVWYLPFPWSASQVKSVTDDLIDMGVFKRTTKTTVTDSNTTCGESCSIYTVLPKVINGNIRLYFNPQTYSNVVYPLTLTENTITVRNATTSGFTSANISFDGVRWTDSGQIAIHLRNDSQANMTGLVGYWSMDENTGTIVHQVNTESGLVNTTNQGLWSGNTTLNYSAGKIGNACTFDGVNDNVNAGNDASLNITTSSVSVLGWIYVKSNTNAGVFGKNYVDSEYSYGIRLDGSNNIYGRWYNETGTAFSSGTFIISLGTWYHVAAVYNSTAQTGRFYLNGILRGNVDNLNNLKNTGKSFMIGTTGNTKFFNGSIDEVRIYNRALSASEIAVLYNTSMRTQGNLTILNQSASMGNVINRTRIVYTGQDSINNISLDATENGTSNWFTVQENMTSNSWYSITDQFNSMDFRVRFNGNGSNTPFFTSLEWDETPLPISEVNNQSFWDYENSSIVFNVSNTDYCEGHLDGYVITSCVSPHDYGLLTAGTYLYSINSTNTTGYLWSNSSAIITITTNFESQWNSYTNNSNMTFNNTPVNMEITYRIDLFNETDVNYMWYKDGVLINGSGKSNIIVLDTLGEHIIHVVATMPNNVSWVANWNVGVLDGWASVLNKLNELENKIDDLPTQDDVGSAGIMGFIGGIIGGVIALSALKKYWRT